MKTLRGVVAGAVLVVVGLLGATAAFGAGELTTEELIYFGESDDPVSQTITLSNLGTDAVTVTAVALVGYPGDDTAQLDQFDFEVLEEEVPFEIPADDEVAVEVTWTPSGERADRAIIRFTHDAGDPIDVDLGGGKPFVIVPANRTIDLGNVNVAQPPLAPATSQTGFNSHDWIRLRHSGPAFPDVTVNGCPTKATPNDDFTVRCLHHPNPVELTTVNNVQTYRTGFHPDSIGESTVEVEFSVGTEDFRVDVSGTGVDGDVLYRVNSGGPIVEVDATSQSFTRDQAGNRSAYFVHGDGTADSNNVAAVNTSHPSIPAGTPDGIFGSARLQGGNLQGTVVQPIVYHFPVEPGLYTVRLYFVEAQLNGAGQRVFDVSINDSLVLPDFDPFAVAGQNNGFARAFLVDADDLVDIELERPPDTPPVLSGVEIIVGGSVELSVPDDVDFGSVAVGGSATESLTITNNAGPDGAAVRIDGMALSGSGADDYEVTGLSAPVWLAPGETLDLDVTFEPPGTGASEALATFDVHGADPLEVNLTGTGVVNTAPVAVNDAYQTNQGTPLVVAAPGVLANDTDANGDPLTAVLAAGPSNGSLNLNASGGFTYTPNAGFSGTDSFTYQANDGQANSSLATVTITVHAGPEEPEEPEEVSFVDIDGSIFTQDILWLARVGITRGCNPPLNDRFCPNDHVTRGQMAAFFVRALQLTDRLDDPFIDDDGHTFEADIEKLAAADITRGCNPPLNDRFCPNDNVTRGQMAAFFVRALGLTDGLDDPFIDDDGHTFEADIEKLAAADITRGCNPPLNDRFCPNDHVTRGQMAAFFHRAADLLGLPR